MEETLEKEIPPSEVKDSNEGMTFDLKLYNESLLKEHACLIFFIMNLFIVYIYFFFL